MSQVTPEVLGRASALGHEERALLESFACKASDISQVPETSSGKAFLNETFLWLNDVESWISLKDL